MSDRSNGIILEQRPPLLSSRLFSQTNEKVFSLFFDHTFVCRKKKERAYFVPFYSEMRPRRDLNPLLANVPTCSLLFSPLRFPRSPPSYVTY